MSYEDGWAALNLEMPARVPHVEVSAGEYHVELVREVTGLDISIDSSPEEHIEAALAFFKAWNYDLYFGFMPSDALNKKYTSMGHAEYAKEGRDFDDNIFCPFNGPEEALAFDPWEVYGEQDEQELVRCFDEDYRQRAEAVPTAATATGFYTTLMSGMIRIFGWDILLRAAATDQERFGALVDRYASWVQQYYTAAAKSAAPLIFSHDDLVWTSGPFIHPDWYRRYIFPNLKKLWGPAIESGKKVIFVCDGDYTQFVDDVVACGAHGFWFEVFTDLNYVTERYGKTHVIIGNGDSRVLTFGTKADVRAEVERCMAAGKRCAGYFMCVSGHIPANVPIENALYYYDVYNELSWR